MTESRERNLARKRRKSDFIASQKEDFKGDLCSSLSFEAQIGEKFEGGEGKGEVSVSG